MVGPPDGAAGGLVPEGSVDTESGQSQGEGVMEGGGKQQGAVKVTQRVLKVGEFEALCRQRPQILVAEEEQAAPRPQSAQPPPTTSHNLNKSSVAAQDSSRNTEEHEGGRESRAGNSSHVGRMFAVLSAPVPRRRIGTVGGQRRGQRSSRLIVDDTVGVTEGEVPNQTLEITHQLDRLRRRRIPESAKEDPEALYLENVHLRERIAKLEADNHISKGQLQSAKSDRDKIDRKLQAHMRSGGDSESYILPDSKQGAVIQRLRSKLRTAESTLATRTSELKSAHLDTRYIRIRDLENEVKDYYTESRRLQTIVDQLVGAEGEGDGEEIQSAKAAVAEALAMIHDKEQSLQKLRSKLHFQSKEVRRRQAAMDHTILKHDQTALETSAKLVEAQYQIVEAQRESTALKAKIDGLKGTLKSEKVKCDNLVEQNIKLASQCAERELKIKRVLEEKSELEKKVAELEAKLSRQQVGEEEESSLDEDILQGEMAALLLTMETKLEETEKKNAELQLQLRAQFRESSAPSTPSPTSHHSPSAADSPRDSPPSGLQPPTPLPHPQDPQEGAALSPPSPEDGAMESGGEGQQVAGAGPPTPPSVDSSGRGSDRRQPTGNPPYPRPPSASPSHSESTASYMYSSDDPEPINPASHRAQIASFFGGGGQSEQGVNHPGAPQSIPGARGRPVMRRNRSARNRGSTSPDRSISPAFPIRGGRFGADRGIPESDQESYTSDSGNEGRGPPSLSVSLDNSSGTGHGPYPRHHVGHASASRVAFSESEDEQGSSQSVLDANSFRRIRERPAALSEPDVPFGNNDYSGAASGEGSTPRSYEGSMNEEILDAYD